MQLEYTLSGRNALDKFIAVSDNGERVEFEVGNFHKTKPLDYEGTFDEINLYLRVIPQQDKNKLFHFFKQGNDILNQSLPNPKYLLPKLLPLVTQMYQVFDLERFSMFNRNKRIIEIPPNLSGEEDAYYPAATTYNDTEYYHLVEFAIAVHLISPIVGEFIKKVRQVTGTDFKELAAYPLFANTPLATMMGWQKLNHYTKAQAARQPESIGPALEGLGPSGYIQYLVAQTVVRRLCINKTQYGPDQKKNLVSVVYGTVNRNSSSSSVGGIVRKKSDYTHRGDDDKDRAFTETYKMKQEVLESAIIGSEEFFLFDLFDINGEQRPTPFEISARTVHPDLDPALVRKCFYAIPEGWTYDLMTHALIIMQVANGTRLSPEAIINFSYIGLMSVVAHTQADLIRRGYEYLPALVSSIIDTEGDVTDYDDEMQLFSDEKKLLAERYHVTLPPHDRANNIGIRSMEMFLDSVKKHPLVSTLPSPFTAGTHVSSGDLISVEINGAVKKEMLALVLGVK